MERTERQKQTLEGLTAKLKELPVLPAVVVRLMATGPEAEGYFDEVLSLAETDPPFAARVIRASNSSDSAPASHIDGLRDAVTRLGARRIGELVTAMAVTRVFVPRTDDQRMLWLHSLQVAVIAREIARHRNIEGLDPDRAYLAGLLHDLGRFVMFDETPTEQGAVDETGWATPDQLVEAEQEICGFDHAELGWHACQLWTIPESISEIVRRHHEHEPAAGRDAAPLLEQSIAVVQLADVLSMLRVTQPKLVEMKKPKLVKLLREGVCALWDPPPISPEALAEVLPGLLEESENAARDLGIGPQRTS